MNQRANYQCADKRAQTNLKMGLVLQRACACGLHAGNAGECAECRKKRLGLQRRAVGQGPDVAPPIVHDVLRSPGRPLDETTRGFMESRFNHDFSGVRVHTDGRAAESARAVNALAYTVGNHVAFGAGQYVPETSGGRGLLAHELAHVVQQRQPIANMGANLLIDSAHSLLEEQAQRAAAMIDDAYITTPLSATRAHLSRVPCTPHHVCHPPTNRTPEPRVEGSATDFGRSEEEKEESARRRRRRFAPDHAIARGHAGHARQLELFLNAQRPGRLAEIRGIFIDMDMSIDTGGMTEDCGEWMRTSLPSGSPAPSGMPTTGRCTLVHGILNQEALTFNRTTDPYIGTGARRQSRDAWRIETLQLLMHETEHPRFERATSHRAAPAGIGSASCTRANVAHELSEIAANMSEYPVMHPRVTAEVDPTGPYHRSQDSWFRTIIFDSDENIRGALLQIGCYCACAEVDAFIRDTVSEVTSTGSWTPAMKTDFNARMRAELPSPTRPSWPL